MAGPTSVAPQDAAQEILHWDTCYNGGANGALHLPFIWRIV
jgi:hypothetical protein